jgi:hypothetical protein
MEALGRNGERGEEEAVAPRDPELLGIDRPLRAEDMAAVDALLGLDEEVIGAAARA